MKKNIIKEISSKQIDNEKLKSILLYMLAFFIPISILIGIFIYLKVYPFRRKHVSSRRCLWTVCAIFTIL